MAEPKEIVQSFYAAVAEGDIPTVMGLMAPQMSWTEAEGFPYAGTYVGPEAILAGVFMRLATEWDGFAAVPAEFLADGNKVVVLGEYSGTYVATGKSFRSPFVHVYTLEDGKLVHFVQHCDTVLVQKALS